MIKKINSPEMKKMIRLVIDELMMKTYSEESFDFGEVIEDVPLFDLLPRNFQIILLSKLLPSILCKSTPCLPKNILYLGTYSAIFHFLKDLVEVEVDMSLIRGPGGHGGVCYYHKKSPELNDDFLSRIVEEDRNIMSKFFGTGKDLQEHIKYGFENMDKYMEMSKILTKHSEENHQESLQKQRKEIRKSMKRKNIRFKKRPEKNIMKTTTMEALPEFYDKLMKQYERPEGYCFEENISEEEVNHAFYYREMVISSVRTIEKYGDSLANLPKRWSFQNISKTHTISYDLVFWDRIMKWIFFPNYISLPDTYGFKKNSKISMKRLLFGALDREKDRFRFDLLKSLMIHEIGKFEKQFSFKEFCRSYHILLLFSSFRGDVYYSKKSRFYKIAKSAVIKDKKEKEKGPAGCKNFLEDYIRKLKGSGSRRTIFIIFHLFMINKNRKYDDLDDKYRTLLEISDDDIEFPFSENNEVNCCNRRESFDQGSIFRVFGERFMGSCALRCEECKKLETLFNLHMKCSACKDARYCSIDCQRKNWKKHKPKCLEIRKVLRKKNRK